MSDHQRLVVAIDGPSGTGKSSVSKAVARQLGIGYLDTGAMYRALAWWCLEHDVELTDQEAVAQAARDLPLEMITDPHQPDVRVDGRSIDAEIRETRISQHVSTVATNLEVRAEMKQRQRDLIASTGKEAGGVVAEGRDITTVIAPDAPVRILMTASEEARMARRAGQLAVSAESTRQQIVDRDAADSTVSSFMTASDGVVTVDTSDIDFSQSVQAVLQVVREVSIHA